jgi:hypothetical protein
MYKFWLYHIDLERPKLIEEPAGWDALGKTIKRDLKWHGVMLEYTPKLKFIKNGRGAIMQLYEQYGIEAEILLFVDVYNRSTFKYERDYTGRINLHSLKVSTLYAEANIEPVGFIQRLLNNQDVKVPLQKLKTLGGEAIEAFTNETIDITLHSRAIKFAASYIPNEDLVPFNPEIGTTLPFKLDKNNLEGANNLLVNEVDGSTTMQWYSQEGQDAKTYPRTIRIHGRLVFTITDPTNFEGEIFIEPHRVGVNLSEPLLYILGDGSGTLPAEASYDLPFDFSQECVSPLWLAINLRFFDPNSSPADYPEYTFDSSSYVIIEEVVTDPTEVVAPLMPVHEAGSRLINILTGVKDAFKSDYYGRTDSEPRTYAADGDGALRGIAPGRWVRGMTDNPMGSSLKDFFESLHAIDGVGMGIEREADGKHVVVMEDLDHFYQKTKVAQFTYVKDLTKSVDQSGYYNELLIGYQKWANEEISNLDEFNSKGTYSLPLSVVNNKLNLISAYLASGYTLEITRRDRWNETSPKDNANDEEIFIVQLRRSAGLLVTDKDEDFAQLENIISPETVYNAKLSLVRNLLRNGKLIAAGLHKQRDKNIILATKEGNNNLVSRLASEATAIDESQDIAVSDLDQPLWIPEIYEFTATPTREQMVAIQDNPYGYIEFSTSDRNFKKGYLLEAQVDNTTREVTFKMLKANF